MKHDIVNRNTLSLTKSRTKNTLILSEENVNGQMIDCH